MSYTSIIHPKCILIVYIYQVKNNWEQSIEIIEYLYHTGAPIGDSNHDIFIFS